MWEQNLSGISLAEGRGGQIPVLVAIIKIRVSMELGHCCSIRMALLELTNGLGSPDSTPFGFATCFFGLSA